MPSALTLATAKLFLNINGVDVARDTKLQAIIDSAEATLADKVGPLASTPQTFRIRVNGAGDTLVLPVMPAISLTSVTGVRTGVAVPTADLYLDREVGLVTYLDNLRLFTEATYDVVYAAGYSPLPADLLNAIELLVLDRWGPQRGPAGKPGTGADKVSTEKAAATDYLPAAVLDLIEPYCDELGFA